jgi:hypothetical protein
MMVFVGDGTSWYSRQESFTIRTVCTKFHFFQICFLHGDFLRDEKLLAYVYLTIQAA